MTLESGKVRVVYLTAEQVCVIPGIMYICVHYNDLGLVIHINGARVLSDCMNVNAEHSLPTDRFYVENWISYFS